MIILQLIGYWLVSFGKKNVPLFYYDVIDSCVFFVIVPHESFDKKKINRKKIVGKFDFMTGGWIGPDVLLSEWICLLTSLLTNESPL